MDIIKNYLSKNIPYFSFRTVLIFTLINTIFLFYFKNVVIRVGMFLICTIILYRFGKLPFADIDPVPFASGLLYLWYGYASALQFIVWTIPTSDAVAGRLNQWSLVNFVSLSLSLTLITLLSSFFDNISLLFFLLLFFNIIRFILTFVMGSHTIIAPVTHTIIYFTLISLFSGLVVQSINYIK